ncbi:MAG TPA: hypothetical protein VKH41_11285 [Myxococcota bacterium]|nr:hypothetical protein [Myxococcota bacterium]
MPAHPPAQTFNHIAMTVPASLLDAPGRASLLDFFGEVFGWTEMPTLTEDGHRLVLRAHSNEQFVFLIADGEPMRCPSGDHFGLSVRTPAELDAILERARKYRERDPRVQIDEKTIEDYRVLRLHSFYVGYRLPMKVEVQCFAWADGVGAQSMPGRA